MSKLLTVVGGTGTQGVSLIRAALQDGGYKVRALTRNPNSSKAKELARKGVEVVQADLNDESSLVKAFKGSNAIFAMTDFFEPFSAHGYEKAIEIEATQGKNLARAASETTTLEHYIWSTLPNGEKLTDGKWKIPHFAAKNLVDDFIKQDKNLLQKTTFLWIAFYANNFQYPIFTPNLLKTSGSYVQLSPAASDVPIQTIGNPSDNIGIFALAILKKAQITLPGRFVLAHVEDTTTGKLLEDWSEVTGKKSAYVQVSLEDFSNIWPGWGLEMGSMMKMWDELRERTWTGEPGILTKNDLGISDAKFVGVKGAIAEMDWNTLL